MTLESHTIRHGIGRDEKITEEQIIGFLSKAEHDLAVATATANMASNA